jgi:hypothetical protein
MGKKGGGGGNSKVEAANAKKAANKAVKDAELSRQQEAADAADWKKGSNARADKKREEEERKRQEAERKKKELQELQAMEEHVMSKHEDKSAQRQMKAKSKSKEPARPWEEALKPTVKKNNKGSRPQIGGSTNKLTQFERDQIAEKEAAEKEKNQSMGGRNDIHFQSFEENRNREEAVEEARSIDAAIDVLSLGGEKDLERHPERRAKAVSMKYLLNTITLLPYTHLSYLFRLIKHGKKSCYHKSNKIFLV